jgi:hypothetical protein
VWRALGACVLAVGFAAGCSVSEDLEPSNALATERRAGQAVASSAAPSPGQSLVTSTPAGSPKPDVVASSAAVSTPAASPPVRSLDVRAILEVDPAMRFETFGDRFILLESVWSPADLGLGGTCLPSITFLDCGLEDWLIQPSQELQPGEYDGSRLELFYGPGVRERLGRDLRPGEGPMDVLGRFGDPRSLDCRPATRDECFDRFVVTAIDLGV